jgi:hypothetical protein
MFRMLFSVLAVMHVAAASSSDHKRLKGEPFAGSVSKAATTIELQETFLDGYVVTANYVDSGCSALSSATSYLLNNCYKESGKYSRYTATATTIILSTYSDAKCQTLVSAASPESYQDTCDSSVKRYVSKTREVPSVTPVALQMLVHEFDVHCWQYTCLPTSSPILISFRSFLLVSILRMTRYVH